jgi:hypothetical protein
VYERSCIAGVKKGQGINPPPIAPLCTEEKNENIDKTQILACLELPISGPNSGAGGTSNANAELPGCQCPHTCHKQALKQIKQQI